MKSDSVKQLVPESGLHLVDVQIPSQLNWVELMKRHVLGDAPEHSSIEQKPVVICDYAETTEFQTLKDELDLLLKNQN